MARSIPASLAVAASLVIGQISLAGGGGQNMLLVVNPDDEASLRMANAYIQARNIPTRNVLYIAPPSIRGYSRMQIDSGQFKTVYQDRILSEIQSRGLASQIDYIGTIGQPHTIRHTYTPPGGSSTVVTPSLNYGLSMLTQWDKGLALQNGMFRQSELLQAAPGYTPPPTSGNPNPTIPPLQYSRGQNAAITHSTLYSPKGGLGAGQTAAQWYLSGNVGYAGKNAITPQQYIDAYARSVAGDGTKPQGTIYFEENDDIRSETREYYWASVQQYMTANNMAWVETRNQPGASPRNKPDVAGAVVSGAAFTMPNGSTYLPGSWGDSLTSNTGTYGNTAHTKADKFIRAGAAGGSGTITEPYAYQSRFTYATMHVFRQEGSTLGEAFFKSVATPDMQMFQGDLLSQAYADVPVVSPGAISGVQAGTVQFSATSQLNNPAIATGIKEVRLYVDGVDKGVVTGSGGTFDLDTTSLSDGEHEVRFVAINNAAAASQGQWVGTMTVNNKGQSVAAAQSAISAAHNAGLSIGVSAAAGSGNVSRVELRSFGRVVGQATGAAGNVSLNASALAFGENELTPVAVFSDGTEVAGKSITVDRAFNVLAGKTQTPAAQRVAGIKAEFFAGAAGRTLALTDLAGRTPDHTLQMSTLTIDDDNADAALRNFPDAYRPAVGGDNTRLAVRMTTSFNVTTAGEYGFNFGDGGNRFESMAIYVDGVLLTNYDAWTGTAFPSDGFEWIGVDTLRNVYLAAGEHDLLIYLNNYTANPSGQLNFALSMKNTDGDTTPVTSASFYSVVPEPAALSLLACGGGMLLRRRTRHAVDA